VQLGLTEEAAVRRLVGIDDAHGRVVLHARNRVFNVLRGQQNGEQRS
jgi:hypothetical protein